MSQNDLVIANQSFPATRADINSALQALGSSSSGTTEPATTYANMIWYDTATNLLKFRSEADDAWISVGYFDQSANAFRILDDTQVTDTSGTQTGILGDQTESAWTTGSSTTESLVSPAKVKAAVKPALNATGSAPVYACRAWVNFNGTGVVAIRGSGNVSSITDNGTGNYTVNFTDVIQDGNYSATASSTEPQTLVLGPYSASSSQILTRSSGGTNTDSATVSLAVFR
jgi:hypothetical protein